MTLTKHPSAIPINNVMPTIMEKYGTMIIHIVISPMTNNETYGTNQLFRNRAFVTYTTTRRHRSRKFATNATRDFQCTCCITILFTPLQSEIGPEISRPIPDETPMHVTNILPSVFGKRSSTTFT